MSSAKLFQTFTEFHSVKTWNTIMMCWKRKFSTSPTVGSDIGLSYTTYPDKDNSIIDPKKKPIIFLHGLFGHKGNLHSVSKHLADDGRKVITYDARNHGDSEHTLEMNYHNMAEDLDGLLEDLSLSTAIVMGHSMGGKTAMNFSLTKPDKVSALIVADVNPGKGPGIDELVKYARAMKDVKIAAGTSLVQARQQAQIQLSSTVANRAVLQFLLTNLRQFEEGGVGWRNNLDAFLNSSSDIEGFPVQTSPFKKPTLFVFGENSEHYRVHDVNKIRAIFPEAEITAIKDAGHFVHADQPLEFVRIVKQFLQKHDGSSS